MNGDRGEENIRHQITSALNDGDATRAIELSNRALETDPSNMEIKYLKAQAYSLKGNVDVYSLFPILKVKLFEFAVTEWNSLEKFSKRQQSGTLNTLSGEDTSNNEELAEDLEELENLPLTEVKYEYKIQYQYDSRENNDLNNDNTIYTGYCYIGYRLESELTEWDNKHVTRYENFETSGEDKDRSCEELFIERLKRFDPLEEKRLVKAKALDIIEDRIDNRKNRKEQERYLKGLFAIYESVDIIKKMPPLNSEMLNELKVSLSILDQTKETDTNSRIKKNSYQQMGLLGGYILIGALKAAINFENVKEPFDLVCNLDPVIAVNNYESFYVGSEYLVKSTKGSSFYLKNGEEIEKIKELIKDAPRELTPETEEHLIDEIQDFIDDNC